jgi:hypothetical protein
MAEVRSMQALRCHLDKGVSHIDPPTSSEAMMRRKIYREENSEPGRYNEEALDYKPGIREQPGSQADKLSV